MARSTIQTRMTNKPSLMHHPRQDRRSVAPQHHPTARRKATSAQRRATSFERAREIIAARLYLVGLRIPPHAREAAKCVSYGCFLSHLPLVPFQKRSCR